MLLLALPFLSLNAQHYDVKSNILIPKKYTIHSYYPKQSIQGYPILSKDDSLRIQILDPDHLTSEIHSFHYKNVNYITTDKSYSAIGIVLGALSGIVVGATIAKNEDHGDFLSNLLFKPMAAVLYTGGGMIAGGIIGGVIGSQFKYTIPIKGKKKNHISTQKSFARMW